jgi:hypothetical protein
VASMIKAGAPLCVPPDKADALPKPMHLACATRSVPKRRLAEGRFLARAIQSRMFAPLHGVFEDPATGSANVALIGLLAHLRPESSLRLKAAIGQGVDLGRPSLPRAVAEKVDGGGHRDIHRRRLQAGDVRLDRPPVALPNASRATYRLIRRTGVAATSSAIPPPPAVRPRAASRPSRRSAETLINAGFGRIAPLQGPPRERPRTGPTPVIHCEREVGFAALSRRSCS